MEETPRSLTLLNVGGLSWYEKCSKNKALLLYLHVTIVIAGILLPNTLASVPCKQAEILQIPKNAWVYTKIVLLPVCQHSSPLQHERAYYYTSTTHSWFIPINHKDKLYINMTTKLKLEVAPTMKQNQKELQSNLLKIGLK